MARWKALPTGLDPAAVQLVAELRRLKDQSGASLERLAVRTGYSASSWERYLGGRLLAPTEAVEALARLAGTDPVPVLALRQAAEDGWPVGRSELASAGTDSEGTTAEAEEETAEPSAVAEPAVVEPSGSAAVEPTAVELTAVEPTPVRSTVESAAEGSADSSGEWRRAWRRPAVSRRTVLNSVGSALVGAGLTLAVTQPWSAAASEPAARPQAVVVPAPTHYLCHYSRSNGQWFAGNSTTSTDTVLVGMDGPEVAELQCLLQRAGFSPGGVDGSFGPDTEKAVVEAQQALHLSVDGQVGPHTWGALRK